MDLPLNKTGGRAPRPAAPRWGRWLMRFVGLLLFMVVLVAAYTIKSRMGIDLFRSFSIKKTLHLKARHSEFRRFASYPKPGVLISDTFERAWFRPEPGSLWAWEPEAVSFQYAGGGEGGSRCLRVENRGQAEWTYVYGTYFPVTPGEIFEYSGWASTQGDARASLGVILYARSGETLDWRYADSGSLTAPGWAVRGRTFVIPAGTDSIRFYLAGRGLGQCGFSKVSLRKNGAADSGRSRP